MKKILSFLTLALLASATAWAYDFSAVAPSGQTLYYNINSGTNTVTVTLQSFSYPYYDTYPTGALTIPSTVTYNSQTYSVTSIGDYAFVFCSGLTSVTIPNSVTAIGWSAFDGCSGLTSVTIPNSVTSIDNSAFRGCSGLTSVTIGNSVTSIGEYAFYGCNGLTSVTIPNSVTSIGERTFYNCSGLTSVTIPNSVTSIGNYAFYHCSGLTSVTIPNSVTSIGEYAFCDCSSLTSITIGNLVTSIGDYAFAGCTGLASISVAAGNSTYDSRNNCNAIIHTSTNTLILGCKNTIIPNSVTSIGEVAFAYCSGLTSVTIPNSVTSIGNYAFKNCTSLTSITSEANPAPQLGTDAFSGVSTNIPVNIPCESSNSYYSRWSYFSNFVESAGHSFSATTADSAMGVVQVLSEPTCTNPVAIIYAAANAGYHFDRWSDDNTQNPRTMAIVSDTAVTAYFAADGGQQGVDDAASAEMAISTFGTRIVVEGVQNETVRLFDCTGRCLQTLQATEPCTLQAPAAGVYLLQVGNRPSQKVVVLN